MRVVKIRLLSIMILRQILLLGRLIDSFCLRWFEQHATFISFLRRFSEVLLVFACSLPDKFRKVKRWCVNCCKASLSRAVDPKELCELSHNSFLHQYQLTDSRHLLYDALVNLHGLKVVWLKLIFSLFDFRLIAVIAVIIIFSIFRTFRILRRVSFAQYLWVLDVLDRFSALGGFLLFFF